MNGEGVPNVVVPTCRYAGKLSKFLKEWYEELKGCHLILLEDRKKSHLKKIVESWAKDGFTYEVHDWTTIEKELKKDAWIISRQDCAIKSFGIYKAWKNKALFTVLLDDDTKPERGGHIKEFYNQLFQPKNTIRNDFYSTLKGKHPRGTFFEEKPEVMIAHGGWLGCLDLDAKSQLGTHEYYGKEFGKNKNFNEGTIPKGCYFSMCGMNLAFKPEIAHAMYFGLNGMMHRGKKKIDVGVRRCDDIWAGYYSKKVCDENGWYVHTGEPYVIHDRASDVWKSLRVEKYAEKMTSLFLARVNRGLVMVPDLEEDSYWTLLAEAYQTWVRLFR